MIVSSLNPENGCNPFRSDERQRAQPILDALPVPRGNAVSLSVLQTTSPTTQDFFWDDRSVPACIVGGKTPEWLLTLATICAGHRLTDDGKLVDDTESLAKIEDMKRALAPRRQTAPYAEWGRWIYPKARRARFAPSFVITPAEAAKFRGDWLRDNPPRTGAGN